ncbi:MAG TPA: hypothetical protein VK596_08045 [Edaphobacter sp.]|nr:hypothetical protein [Edaphobacter sp.]
MPNSKAILLYGHEKTLLFTRRAILEKAGFCVFSALDLKEVQSFSSAERIKLLVICHSVSLDEQEMAVSLALVFNPRASVLALNNVVYGWSGKTLYSVVAEGSDGSILTGNDFLAAVEEAIDHSQKPESLSEI